MPTKDKAEEDLHPPHSLMDKEFPFSCGPNADLFRPHSPEPDFSDLQQVVAIPQASLLKQTSNFNILSKVNVQVLESAYKRFSELFRGLLSVLSNGQRIEDLGKLACFNAVDFFYKNYQSQVSLLMLTPFLVKIFSPLLCFLIISKIMVFYSCKLQNTL